MEHLWRMIRLQLILTITAYLLKILALEHLVIIMVIAQVDLIWRQLLRMLILVDVSLVWLFKSMTLCHYSHCLLYIDRDIWLVSKVATRFRMTKKFGRAFNCDLIGRYVALNGLTAQWICVLACVEDWWFGWRILGVLCGLMVRWRILSWLDTRWDN